MFPVLPHVHEMKRPAAAARAHGQQRKLHRPRAAPHPNADATRGDTADAGATADDASHIKRRLHNRRSFRTPFYGTEEEAKAYLGEDIPHLVEIKKSLGCDQDFMVVISEEDAHGRNERCSYDEVVNGKKTKKSVYWENVDDVLADRDLSRALNFGDEIVIPDDQPFVALCRVEEKLEPVVMGVHMDNIANCHVDDATIAGKWHNRRRVSKRSNYFSTQ